MATGVSGVAGDAVNAVSTGVPAVCVAAGVVFGVASHPANAVTSMQISNTTAMILVLFIIVFCNLYYRFVFSTVNRCIRTVY